MSTETEDLARRPIARNTSCIAGASPTISSETSTLPLSPSLLPLFFLLSRTKLSAFFTRLIASSMSKGFGRYSNVPLW